MLFLILQNDLVISMLQAYRASLIPYISLLCMVETASVH